MIVTCERCSTQFRLDDKRVPEQGVRVRCSRCKYAFRVEPPVASEEERVQRAVARGLEPDTPDVTQDMPDEEADWEFNDDQPTAHAQESEIDEVAADPDVQEPEGSEIAADSGGEENESPLDQADAETGDAGAVSPSVEPLDGYDNDSPLAPSGLDLNKQSTPFDSAQPAGPLDHIGQDEAESGLDLAGPSDSPIGLDPAIAEGAESEPEEPPTPMAEPEAPEQPNASVEMGGPDNWDFFAADSSDAGATPTRVRMSATPPRARVPRAAPVPHGLLSEESEPHSHWLERIVGSAGWVVVAAALAAGLYGGFAPHTSGSTLAGVSQRVAGLQIADVRGRWVDNLVAGDLYVVSGAARRDAAADDTARGGLFVTLLDAEGERLRMAPIPVGRPLSQSLLRQADPAELHRAAGQAISPGYGGSLRIEAVIPAPPAAARAFRFVAPEELTTPDAETAAPLASAELRAPEPELPSGHPSDAP